MKLIYGISDKPKTVKEWILYAFQQVMAVFVATVLIANICGTPISACLIGACIGTLIYQLITKFKSPMFISSCGATCSAVIGALALGNGGPNYIAVTIGGVIIFLIYAIFAAVAYKSGAETINKVFPPTIIGAVTLVIGLNLATYIKGYTQVGGQDSSIGVLVALFTMIVVALTSHYFKGFMKTIPFLLGLAAGYGLSTILTLTGVAPLIDFSAFKNISIVSLPEFTFLKWGGLEMPNLKMIGEVALLFVPVAICATLEHLSDHRVLSNIIGTDLTKTPGLHRTLLGDGLASAAGTLVCGLPNTSYGESIATTGFSRVASVAVITLAAAILGVLSFFTPVQVFINSIPSCVFGGCAMILYGYIAASGLKTLFNNKVDLENNKNLIVVSAILTIGVSGIFLFSQSFAGVSLAMVVGVILNLILRNKKLKSN